jgi:hypothetical protein
MVRSVVVVMLSSWLLQPLGAGMAVLQATYWQTFAYSCVAALIAATVAFLQNVAGILPEDPTQ